MTLELIITLLLFAGLVLSGTAILWIAKTSPNDGQTFQVFAGVFHVDEIIAAAKPGGGPPVPTHQAQPQTEAKASPPHHPVLSGIEHAVEGAVHAIEHAVEDMANPPKPPGERRQGERRGKT